MKHVIHINIDLYNTKTEQVDCGVTYCTDFDTMDLIFTQAKDSFCEALKEYIFEQEEKYN